MNEQTAKVDPDVLAGFNRLESMAGEGDPAPSAAPSTGADLQPAAPAWLDESKLVVEVVAAGVAPNWTWAPEHKAMIAAALAKVLNKYMPGGLAMIEQWGPWAELAAAVGFVAVGNIDWQTMKLKPLRAPADPVGEAEQPAPPPPVAPPKKKKPARKKSKPAGETDAKS